MDGKYARDPRCDLYHTEGFAAAASGGSTLDPLTDDQLAAAAAAGDTDAFEVLVARMSPALIRYLRRMVADPQLVEDLAQDTLLDAWKGLPDFAFRSTFRTWMFSIAHRKVVDHRRRRHDIPAAEDRFTDLATPEPQPADAALRSTLMDALQIELEILPATPRAVWWLREVEGLSLDEIARVLRLSDGAVRGHLQRTRKRLTTRLAPWQPGAHEGVACQTARHVTVPVGRHRPVVRSTAGPHTPEHLL